MYVTRPRSLYKLSSEDAFYEATPEGPNSGYLVIGNKRIEDNELPLPHDRILCATYIYDGEHYCSEHVLFIPVINQPLCSSRYYVIRAGGHKSSKGLAYESSTEEEDTHTNCWGGTFIAGRKPRSLNPLDVYQQFEVTRGHSAYYPFKAKSIALDGVITDFLRQQWDFYITPYFKYKISELSEASGLDNALRKRLPYLDVPLSTEVVGKWVCPFMFIRDGKPRDQIMKSTFYEMTLDQSWERVFACENTNGASSVEFNVMVPTQVVMVNGKEAVAERDEAEGVLWFTSVDDQMKNTKVGLSLVIVERMMWEEERVGWAKGNENKVMVSKVESFTQGGNAWKRYGFYVLVERFLLKRANRSLVLTYEFKHTHQTRCIWE